MFTRQVLRFSRLFGPGKIANLPKIWKGVKRKKKKKFGPGGEDKGPGDDSFPGEETSPTPEIPKGFELQFAPEPQPYMCVADDSVSTASYLLLNKLYCNQSLLGVTS